MRPSPLPTGLLLVLPLLLAALAPASGWGAQDEGPDQAAIDRAIDRGVTWLLATQELDGSWRYKPHEYPAGQTALSVYTLAKSGLPKDHPAIRRALTYLRAQPVEETYAASCLLLALTAVDPIGHRAWIDEVTKKLLGWQTGGWAYPKLQVDLSNTQYAALALRAAAETGTDVPKRAWQRLAAANFKHQKDDGGFCYRLSEPSTGSMTAAGLGVLGIARERLAAQGSLTRALDSKIAAAVERGLAWLAEHFSASENPEPADPERKHDRWLFYWLYGLERVGSLLAIDTIGEHAWYAAGARFLVAEQEPKGSWGTPSGERPPNTCFALLFLQRATAPRTGPDDRGVTRTWGTDDPQEDVSLRAVGDAEVEVWVSSWGEHFLATYEWEGETGRGPRVASVEYLADGVVVERRGHDPTQPSERQRFAYRHVFAKLGSHTLQARLHVVPPGSSEPGEDALAVIESSLLELKITAVLEPWMIPYAEDPGRNLVRPDAVSVEASSTLRAGFDPELAVDGLQTRMWLCGADDPAPVITIEFQKPVKADTLLLSHARADPLQPQRFARAVEVELVLNRKKPLVIRMDPDEQRKTIVRFDRRENVRRLELRVLERVPGTAQKQACGFAEIELIELPEDDPRR